MEETKLINELFLKYSEKIHKHEYNTYNELKNDFTKNENVNKTIKTNLLSSLKNICLNVSQRTYHREPYEIVFSGNVNDECSLTSTHRSVMPNDISQEDWERLKKKNNLLCSIKSPEQRTPEWFSLRNNVITASNVSTCLGNNPYEPSYSFILEKIYGRTFSGDIKTYHGRVFEDAVALVYELYHNCKIIQLGIIPHVGDDNGNDKKNIIAISPDGLIDSHDHNGNPSKFIGRLIEIKCPYQRVIKTSGDYAEVIPHYYLEQIYLQLEATNMEACDFVQCKISRYDSYVEYLNDTDVEKNYMSKQHKMPRGAVIELLPFKLPANKMVDGVPTDQAIHEDTTFIHPTTLLMTNEELNTWVMLEIDKLTKQNKVRLFRVTYWKMTQHVFTLVPRCKSIPWMTENYPKMKACWEKVLFLRENPDVCLEWKTFIDNLKRKVNVTIMKKLDELCTLKKNGKFIPTIKPNEVIINNGLEQDEDNHHHGKAKVNYDAIFDS